MNLVKTRQSLMALVVEAAVLITALPALAEEGWALEQINTYAPSGQWTVTLGDKGIKASDGTLMLLFKAPKFDAIMANQKTKQLVSISNKEWVRTFVKGGNYANFESAKDKWIRPGTKTGHIAGLDVKQYFLYWKVKGKDHLYREFWTTTQIKLPSKHRQVLNLLCDAPHCEGIPLRVMECSDDGKKQMILNTLEAKRVEIVAANFAKPQGFKTEKNTTALLLSVGQGKDFADMLNDEGRR